MKKILLLGSGELGKELVIALQRLGQYVVATDSYKNAPAMQKIISELIQAKQIKVLLAKNETMLFSDPSLDLTDDVTSMLDVAAAEAPEKTE